MILSSCGVAAVVAVAARTTIGDLVAASGVDGANDKWGVIVLAVSNYIYEQGYIVEDDYGFVECIKIHPYRYFSDYHKI